MFYREVDEILELFKGAISIDDIKYKYSNAELTAIKKARVERLRAEQKAIAESRNGGNSSSVKRTDNAPVGNRNALDNLSDSEVIAMSRAQDSIMGALGL